MPYLFIISLDYILQTSIDWIKEKGFHIKKSRQYSTETMTNADDLALFGNTPA